MKGKVYDTFIKVGKQTLITSHEIPILRTIKYLYKDLITVSRDFGLSCMNLRMFVCAYIVHILYRNY